MENMFGMINGKYFGEPPLYVNKQLAAGMTDMPKPTLLGWIRNSPLVLIATPNFVWAIFSLALYTLVPYNLTVGSFGTLSPITYACFLCIK